MADINEIVYILFEVGLFDDSSPPSNKHYTHVDGEATINDPSGRKDFEEANRRVRVGNLGKGSRVTKNIGYYENEQLEELDWGKFWKHTKNANRVTKKDIFGSKSPKSVPERRSNIVTYQGMKLGYA